MPAVNNDDLTVCNACFCCNALLYFDVPDCIGCSGKGQCLCCRDACCCKMGQETFPIGLMMEGNDGAEAGDIFGLSLPCCQCAITKAFLDPLSICKGSSQMCCIVENVALPPSDDIPLMCGICTVVLFPSFGVFKKQSEYK